MNAPTDPEPRDPRDIRWGSRIPCDDGYVDQPYVVVMPDGSWVCVLTTGSGPEGHPRQHVVSTISRDQGRTWEPPVDIEPAGPPEGSWAMPILTEYGRIYVVYVYNTDNLRSAPTLDGPDTTAVHLLGDYVFKYSDDGGSSWSQQRYRIPLRATAMDRRNVFGGSRLFFWGVGKPIIHDGSVYVGASRVGDFVRNGTMSASEGMPLRSDNLLTERDPDKITWVQLPDDDHALRAPNGPIAEEHSIAALSDGSVCVVYRTIDGYLGQAYSHDRGHHWTEPAYAAYALGDRRIKHPRAAGFIRRFSNGKYLLWFHNNSRPYFMARNPGWFSGGVEIDGRIHWSEPEIALYDSDSGALISYPDFIEHDGRYWLTETQKEIARVHELDPDQLERLWDQHQADAPVTTGRVVSLDADDIASGRAFELPRLGRVTPSGGLTVELTITVTEPVRAGVVAGNRDRYGRGFNVCLDRGGRIGVELSDRHTEVVAWSDPGGLADGQPHHVVFIVDGMARVVSVVVDGVLCDGGDATQGWVQFYTDLGTLTGNQPLLIDNDPHVSISLFRVYDRSISTSEAVSGYRHESAHRYASAVR